MIPAKQLDALRHAVASSAAEHTALLRVSGDAAFPVVNRLCTSDLRLRDHQMRHTLLLDEDARVLADAYICRDDEDYLLLLEGMSYLELLEHVDTLPVGSNDAAIEDLREHHELLAIDGPYAWELLASALSPDIVGQPFMSCYEIDGVRAFRAGKTGEYGYLLLAPASRAGDLRERIDEEGRKLDLVEVGQEALDQCALENWFFNIRREGLASASPIELQLQWRLSPTKEFVGSAALAALRAAGQRRRNTCL
ncbi:MAG: aminomethyltransferase family protein, partial [Deltaproteobacteria bacterium]|nr:aminomethyltransferase family protein [Deltaproteobacteria bacterium]